MGHSIQYDLGAMQVALGQCDNNIKVFEDAIAKERAKKAEYRIIIDTLQAKLDQPEPKVNVEFVADDDPRADPDDFIG
jgi:hypothetical protein